MSTRRPGRYRRLAGTLFAVAAFTFLAVFVARNLEQLRAHEWSIRPGLLGLSILLNIVGLAWGVRVWQLLLRRLDTSVRYLALARVWFVSGLGRYIPGKVWQFVGAAHLGRVAGLSPTIAVTSLAVHTGLFILGALVVAVYLVPSPVGDLGGIAVDIVRWTGPLLLLLAHPALIGGCLNLVRRATSSAMAEWRAGWGYGVGLVLLSAIGWIVSGAALFLFILALTPLPLSGLTGVIGINALAFVAGYVVFIAPAGLGAKETALTALLAFYVPAPVAAVLAIAARLWTVAAELIPALLLLGHSASDALPAEPEPSATGASET
ncbi:MAG: lysylphosphatidylglycerol synthase domain-containing protein [Gemmatimonadota bacterium]